MGSARRAIQEAAEGGSLEVARSSGRPASRGFDSHRPSMIIRREFLKRVVFATLATVLPEIPLPRKEERDYPELEHVPLDNPAFTYALGFAVTQEIFEDDLYGKGYVAMLEDFKRELEEELVLRFRAVV